MRGNGMKMRLFSAESQFQSLRWGMLLSIDCDRFAKFEEKNIWYRKYLMFNYLQILTLIVLNWKDLIQLCQFHCLSILLIKIRFKLKYVEFLLFERLIKHLYNTLRFENKMRHICYNTGIQFIDNFVKICVTYFLFNLQ